MLAGQSHDYQASSFYFHNMRPVGVGGQCAIVEIRGAVLARMTKQGDEIKTQSFEDTVVVSR